MSQNFAACGVQTHATLHEAMLVAQSECRNARMNRENTHFRSRYADLVEVRDAVLPVFQRNGLLIQQRPRLMENGAFILETSVIHVATGEAETSEFPLNGDVNKIQTMGSTLSYARRYALSTVAGIAADSDNDGNEQLPAPTRIIFGTTNIGADSDGTLL